MKKIIVFVTAIILVMGGFVLLTKGKTIELVSEHKNDKQTALKDKIAEGNQQKKQIEDKNNTVKEKIIDALQDTLGFFQNKQTNIVALGDSLTEGIGDNYNQGGYVGILQRTINKNKKLAHFDNFGKQGDRTSNLLTKLDDPNISQAIKQADIILITIGANDIMQIVKENFTNLTYDVFEQEQVHYEQRMEAIFTKLKQLNADANLYLIGFYNPFENYFEDIKELNIIVDNWNQTSKSITEEFSNSTYIPIKDIFDNANTNLFAEDHFHPNSEGYQRMAERILNYITNNVR